MARMPWVAVVALLALPAPAHALPSGNTLVNPDAESSPGATGFGESKPPSGWTVTGAFTAITYAADGSPPVPPGGGAQYFAGGNGAQSSAEQTVDLSAYAAEIDAQNSQATLSGLLGGYDGQDDNVAVDAILQAADGSALAAMRIGPALSRDRAGNAFVTQTATAALPAGTRSVRVVMTATRTGGDYNDGYADNISLTFGPRPAPQQQPAPQQPATTTPSGPPPPAFGPSGVFQGLPPVTRCLSKRRFTINVRNRGRVWETVVVVLDGKRLKARRPTRKVRHWRSLVDLRGFPKRKVPVKLTAVSKQGEVVSGKRTYHTCEPFRRAPKKRRL